MSFYQNGLHTAYLSNGFLYFITMLILLCVLLLCVATVVIICIYASHKAFYLKV